MYFKQNECSIAERTKRNKRNVKPSKRYEMEFNFEAKLLKAEQLDKDWIPSSKTDHNSVNTSRDCCHAVNANLPKAKGRGGSRVKGSGRGRGKGRSMNVSPSVEINLEDFALADEIVLNNTTSISDNNALPLLTRDSEMNEIYSVNLKLYRNWRLNTNIVSEYTRDAIISIIDNACNNRTPKSDVKPYLTEVYDQEPNTVSVEYASYHVLDEPSSPETDHSILLQSDSQNNETNSVENTQSLQASRRELADHIFGLIEKDVRDMFENELEHFQKKFSEENTQNFVDCQNGLRNANREIERLVNELTKEKVKNLTICEQFKKEVSELRSQVREFKAIAELNESARIALQDVLGKEKQEALDKCDQLKNELATVKTAFIPLIEKIDSFKSDHFCITSICENDHLGSYQKRCLKPSKYLCCLYGIYCSEEHRALDAVNHKQRCTNERGKRCSEGDDND